MKTAAVYLKTAHLGTQHFIYNLYHVTFLYSSTEAFFLQQLKNIRL